QPFELRTWGGWKRHVAPAMSGAKAPLRKRAADREERLGRLLQDLARRRRSGDEREQAHQDAIAEPASDRIRDLGHGAEPGGHGRDARDRALPSPLVARERLFDIVCVT